MVELNDIITSKVRVKLLELFFTDPTELYYVRSIVREVKEEINAVRRELKRLEEAGILKSETRGNRLYYWPKDDYPFFGELLSMVAKTKGLGADLRSVKDKIGRINFLMFSGRFVRRKSKKREDDVDILIVGEVVLPELANIIRKEESKRGREINYTVMGREEFEFRKKRRDPFLHGILSGGRVMIIGDQDNLVS